MKLFAICILKYFIKVMFFTCIAFCGLYVGYRFDHGMEIYLKKERKQILKHGKLIAYMNRHYRATYKESRKYEKKRNEKWLYKKCYNYAKLCGKIDIKMAISYLKTDIKQCEVFTTLISICVGFSNQIVNPYAHAMASYLYKIRTTTGLSENQVISFDELNENLQTLFCLCFAMFLLLFLYKFSKTLKKQRYLLCILEDVEKMNIGMR